MLDEPQLDNSDARDLGRIWASHMQHGEFEAAWAVSDEVMRSRAPGPCSHLPRHLQWVWDGSSLEGRRVLIRCYHGLGDTIQFIRYAPLVKSLAADVSVWAQPELIPLLRSASGIDRLVALHDGEPDVEYDVDVEVMELPHVFRSTVDSLPNTTPYLSAPPAPLKRDGRLKIGLVTKAGDFGQPRSIPHHLVAPLGKLSDVDVYLLHPTPPPISLAGISLAPGLQRIEATASLMRALDLVVSVDSMAAHLAGALAVPVWTLLRHDPDWRWISGRDDCPWYPSMRLFRQPRPGDWASVVESVVAELGRLVRMSRREHSRGEFG